MSSLMIISLIIFLFKWDYVYRETGSKQGKSKLGELDVSVFTDLSSFYVKSI